MTKTSHQSRLLFWSIIQRRIYNMRGPVPYNCGSGFRALTTFLFSLSAA